MSTITQNQTSPDQSSSLGDQAKESIKSATDSAKSRWAGLGRETRRTITYAVAGVVCLAITGGVEVVSRPAAIKEYGKVGKAFFPEFKDPTLATALNVQVIDKDQVSAKEFSVERTADGRWVIPSHHNYPADAEEQLARTASSVIGITRGALVSRWASDHARYGVVDPEVDSLSVDQIEGVGKRLTFRGENDSILADYIIGHQVEDEFGQYYVRHPSEDETYIAELNIDLTTKFSDWIDTDLLDINTFDIVHVGLNDYQFDELNATITHRDVTTLSRESSSDDWEMAEIEENLEVHQDAVRKTINAIAGLEISGVRPKQKGLRPDLQLDREVLRSQRDVDRLQSDLLSRGFLLQPVGGSDPDALKLIAREGELSTATNEGLVYHLYFGRVFTGSQEELEIGLSPSSEADREGKKESQQAEGDAKVSGEASKDSQDSDQQTDDASVIAEDENEKKRDKPGRYVFVTVKFDKTYLGDEPQKPTEPEMPSELKEADAKTASDEKDASETASDNENSIDAESDESTGENEKLEQIRQDYEQQKSDYEDAVREYESYQEKMKNGQEKAEKLNRRFAQWYYVIPGEDYDDLALTRTDFIKAKVLEEDEEDNEADTADDAAKENADVAESESSIDDSPGDATVEESSDDNSAEQTTGLNSEMLPTEQVTDESAGPGDSTGDKSESVAQEDNAVNKADNESATESAAENAVTPEK
ncbi:DUF4340 domain-containing protein [Aporhodopirellula aestuarii]|uniref:DUF4340 domain-containing protein n=1 Tax=Aporhodopirellula aestuarii TaxID=2950107 RepID=A0ABT0UAH0_9BACT|nr:DUF4340 domain-containing protein [Aporhodopirellula aestuarii]MCM2373689.1 DUF4340 domain-containing protein [Aporhodopirellula aestuarii]